MIKLPTRELILRWKKEGKTQQEIAALAGCNQSSISRLIAKFNQTGNVKNLPRSGRPTPLTKKTLAKLKAEFTKEAKAANKKFCSIDAKQFSKKIENRTQKKYSDRHVMRILHRIDFSRITPRSQHIKNDPEKIKEFREEFKKLEKEYLGYEIIAIDEASFQLATTYKKIWYPRGETPRAAFFWSNKKLITFGALTSNHKFYYDFYEAQNSMTFMNFLRELFKKIDQKKKYVLIMDNAGFHKTSCVRNLIAEYSDKICVEHIPPYSPELNPIETCWKVTKNSVTKSQYFPTIDGMQEALENFWTEHIFMQEFMRYLCR